MEENDGIMQELLTLATTLYGTNADLNFVTRMTGKNEHVDEIRTLLRSECGLVQDPITRVWMQLLPRSIEMSDIIPPAEGS